MSEPKSKETAKPAESRQLQNLHQQEKRLKNKLAQRIPNFPEGQREQAELRARQHLDGVQAAIKKASKS